MEFNLIIDLDSTQISLSASFEQSMLIPVDKVEALKERCIAKRDSLKVNLKISKLCDDTDLQVVILEGKEQDVLLAERMISAWLTGSKALLVKNHLVDYILHNVEGASRDGLYSGDQTEATLLWLKASTKEEEERVLQSFLQCVKECEKLQNQHQTTSDFENQNGSSEMNSFQNLQDNQHRHNVQVQNQTDQAAQNQRQDHQPADNQGTVDNHASAANEYPIHVDTVAHSTSIPTETVQQSGSHYVIHTMFIPADKVILLKRIFHDMCNSKENHIDKDDVTLKLREYNEEKELQEVSLHGCCKDVHLAERRITAWLSGHIALFVDTHIKATILSNAVSGTIDKKYHNDQNNCSLVWFNANIDEKQHHAQQVMCVSKGEYEKLQQEHRLLFTRFCSVQDPHDVQDQNQAVQTDYTQGRDQCSANHQSPADYQTNDTGATVTDDQVLDASTFSVGADDRQNTDMYDIIDGDTSDDPVVDSSNDEDPAADKTPIGDQEQTEDTENQNLNHNMNSIHSEVEHMSSHPANPIVTCSRGRYQPVHGQIYQALHIQTRTGGGKDEWQLVPVTSEDLSRWCHRKQSIAIHQSIPDVSEHSTNQDQAPSENSASGKEYKKYTTEAEGKETKSSETATSTTVSATSSTELIISTSDSVTSMTEPTTSTTAESATSTSESVTATTESTTSTSESVTATTESTTSTSEAGTSTSESATSSFIYWGLKLLDGLTKV